MTRSTESDLTGLYSATVRAGRQPAQPESATPIRWDLDRVLPAPENYPLDFLRGAAADALEDPDSLTYEVTRLGNREKTLGYEGLRAQIAAWMSARQGVSLDIDNIVLTSGAAQANALNVAAFVDAGDGVVVESWTWPSMVRFLQMRGAEIRAAEVDADGVVVESIEERLHELRDAGIVPKLLYLIPTFHLPTLTVLPLERRRRILELADEWNLVVIEDDVYGELGDPGFEPPASMLSLDSSGRVIQTKTFSKMIAPGMRLGWTTADHRMVDAIEAVRQDIGVSQWLARVAERFLAEGRLDPHIDLAQRVHARKRDLACATVAERAAGAVHVERPAGGLHLWVRADERLDWDGAVADAARAGVNIATRGPLLETDGDARYFRLGYCQFRDDDLEQALDALCGALSRNVA